MRALLYWLEPSGGQELSPLADYNLFAHRFLALLPPLDGVEESSNEFWETLEVNASRVSEDSRDRESVEITLSPLGVAALQVTCLWAGVEPLQRKPNLRSAVAEYIAANLGTPGCHFLDLLNKFLYRRRSDAIEAISSLILPQAQFDLVYSSDIDVKSKRLCYSLLVYLENPHQLRLLMLYERAERAGYTRYVLMPRAEVSGEPLTEESAELVRQHIEKGADLATLDEGRVNDVLEMFEAKHGDHRSLCFDLFRDAATEMTLIFILRHFRESHIREVDGIVFADEAELIVLRLADSIRMIEEHSASGEGVRIATDLAAQLLKEPNVEYIEDTCLTSREAFVAFIDMLANAADDRLRFQELYLGTAPIDESPRLILRCDKTTNLSGSLDFLKHRNVDLLQDLDSIRNINIAFVVETANRQQKAFIFKVFCRRVRSHRFFIP